MRWQSRQRASLLWARLGLHCQAPEALHRVLLQGSESGHGQQRTERVQRGGRCHDGRKHPDRACESQSNGRDHGPHQSPMGRASPNERPYQR